MGDGDLVAHSVVSVQFVLLLTPDIQKRVLFLESVDGREIVGERALRRLATASWKRQRATLSSMPFA